MEKDQFFSAFHCMMYVTSISALSTRAFGFILHLRLAFLPFLQWLHKPRLKW